MHSEKSLESIRDDFPALQNLRKGRPPVYFDNACTMLVPRQVIRAMDEYYSRFPACGGRRSRHWFAREVSARIEGDDDAGVKGSRRIIQEFINARSVNEIIFTMNTTQAINTVALGFKFNPGDVVLLTDKEHNSNLVPWLRLQQMGLIKVDRVTPQPDDTFDMEGLKNKLENNRVRLVSLAYTSNLTGYTIPAREIIDLAHGYGARVLLDGAQTVPHHGVDVQYLEVDFLAFSIHKMCGPRGIGVLYGKSDLLGQRYGVDAAPDSVHPVILGGGTINESTYSSYSLLESPESFEAGIQDYAGQIAAGAAIEYLQHIGMERIKDHGATLNRFLTGQLMNRYGDEGWFKILGPQDAAQRGGILTFEVKLPNAVGIAEELDEKNNIMVRDGVFCVHSFFNNVYGQGWTRPRLPSEHRMIYRVSLYFYNTIEECQIFLDTLHQVFEERSYI